MATVPVDLTVDSVTHGGKGSRRSGGAGPLVERLAERIADDWLR